jgi:Domain of unknown function (DUF4915)
LRIDYLEDNLLVSSPGEAGYGGLVYLEKQSQVIVSKTSSTGICFGETGLVWAQQDKDGRYLIEVKEDSVKSVEVAQAPLDIHDVLVDQNLIYLAATQSNEVICVDSNYNRVNSWRLPGEEDSSHLNSVAIYRGELIASIFGSFTKHREYKEGTLGLGKIINVRTGEVLIDGLSQPHSLTVKDDLLYFCSSEEKKLYVYDGKRIINTVLLPGYARGVAVGDNYIYVGISLSRNIETNLHELSSGAISIIDKKLMKYIGVKTIPFREVYDIRIVKRYVDLLRLIEAKESEVEAKESEVKETREKLAVCEVEIAKLNQLQAERDASITLLEQTLAERDASITLLEQTLAALYTSHSWRMTKLFRVIKKTIKSF